MMIHRTRTVATVAAALLLAAPCIIAQQPAPTPVPLHKQWDHPPMEMRGHEGMGFMDHDKGDRMPTMMWWKSPETVKAIGLTPEQVKKIDDLFLQNRVQLIHLHASLEEEELLLEPLMNANPIDQNKASAQIDKIAETRANLEKSNAKMFLSIRSVLSADQWTKLRSQHHMHHGSDGPWGPKGRNHPDGPPPAAAPGTK